MNKIDDYFTPMMHRALVKGILSVLTNILNDAGIVYWIDGGTLLGAVREQNMIQWDDDADIGIFYKEFMTKLPNLYEIIESSYVICDGEKYMLSIELSDSMTKVYIKNLWARTNNKRIIGTPTIDIFPWQISNGKVELSSSRQRKQFKNCYYTKKELFPLKLHNFGGCQFYGANEPVGYLNRYYGSDWKTKAKIEIREPTEQSSTNKSSEFIEFDLQSVQ